MPEPELTSDVRVLQSQVAELRLELDQRFQGQDKNVRLALDAADKTTGIAQQTADRAVMKAEAAASREYLEAQIAALRDAFSAAMLAQREALSAALAAAEKAISKAEDATEKRFSSVNEFRQTLSDQQAGFATKTEVNLRFNAIEDKLHTALTTLSETRGKSQGANWLWGVFVASVGIVLTVVSVVAILLTRN